MINGLGLPTSALKDNSAEERQASQGRQLTDGGHKSQLGNVKRGEEKRKGISLKFLPPARNNLKCVFLAVENRCAR